MEILKSQLHQVNTFLQTLLRPPRTHSVGDLWGPKWTPCLSNYISRQTMVSSFTPNVSHSCPPHRIYMCCSFSLELFSLSSSMLAPSPLKVSAHMPPLHRQAPSFLSSPWHNLWLASVFTMPTAPQLHEGIRPVCAVHHCTQGFLTWTQGHRKEFRTTPDP